MKKLILCSMLAAFAVAVQADDARKTDKAAEAKACCAEKSACCAKTAKKADSTAKGATLLVQR